MVQDPVIDRAPTVVVVSLLGASPDTVVDFTIDGQAVTSVTADSDGSLFYLSITVSAALGTQGLHTLRATQVTGAGTKTAEATFVVNRAPAQYPVNMNTDAAPVFVAEAVVDQATQVQHWVMQDLLAAAEGGIGSWVMPFNPKEMGSPHFERTTTAKHTTSATGRFHVFETGSTPKEWTFSGYCPNEQMARKLAAYRALNRRFYIIDHHNRAWIVAATNLEIVPRLRHIFNGEVTDWGSDYTMTVTVLSQDWRTPQ